MFRNLSRLSYLSRFSFLLIGLFANFVALGAPASGRPVIVVGPDGNEVEVIAVGDEHSRHYVYADTKEKVAWLPSGTQNVGVRPLSTKILNGENNHSIFGSAFVSAIGPGANSSRLPVAKHSDSDEDGQQKFLVVLVDFPDRSFTTSNPHQAFEEIMNSDAMPVRGSYGSARRYFEEQSNGAFLPNFEVVGPVTMSHNAAYYASVGVDDSPTGKVLQEACLQLDSQLDFTDYDLDGDGVCDNVYLFYAGRGQADGGGTTTIWPHSARLDIDWGIEVVVDGVKISNYACSAELNGNGQFSGIGTFCHEFCHVLGLPDLYYSGVAHPQYFSLMASGNYNGNGYYPPNLSVYERFALGWITPEEFLQSEWVTLTPLPEDADTRIVKTASENEYFLLENRQKEGWDSYLPGHGLLIWHIDYDQQAWDNNIPNADRNHQRVFLVRANNNLSGYPNAAAPFPGTTGVDAFTPETSPAFLAWDGTPVDCALTTISETPSGNITFRAETSRASLDRIEQDVNPSGAVDSNLPCRIFAIDGREMPSDSALPAGVYIRTTPAGTVKFVVN